MDYIISEQKFIKLDSDSVSHIEAVLFASSTETLPDYDDIPSTLLVPGSIALVPSESKVYVLDLDNEWKEWNAEEEEDTRSVSAPSNLTKSNVEELRTEEPEVTEEEPEETEEEPEEEVKEEVKKNEKQSPEFTPFK